MATNSLYTAMKNAIVTNVMQSNSHMTAMMQAQAAQQQVNTTANTMIHTGQWASTAADAGSTAKGYPPSKRAQALASLQGMAGRKSLDKVNMHYRHIGVDDVINVMGGFPSVMNNRPVKWVMPLLCCASAPHKFTGQMAYRYAGLTFVNQANPMGKFAKMRLTVAGYELLVHFAKNKKFKLFFDAFVSKTAKDEIYAACFDFEMNALPDFIQKDGILMAERKARKDARTINDLRQWANQNIYTNINTASPTWVSTTSGTGMLPMYQGIAGGGGSTLVTSGGLAGAGYSNSLAGGPTIGQNEAYNIANALRRSSNGLHVSVNADHVYVTDAAGMQHLVWKPA